MARKEKRLCGRVINDWKADTLATELLPLESSLILIFFAMA